MLAAEVFCNDHDHNYDIDNNYGYYSHYGYYGNNRYNYDYYNHKHYHHNIGFRTAGILLLYPAIYKFSGRT